MASISSLRLRRSEAQLHALAGVEREIRVNDPNGRRKYLRDFSQAFRSYQSVIDHEQLQAAVAEADSVLIGDYHALAAAQLFAATLLEERAQSGDRPLVLGVETIFSRDQHILDEWWRREIDEEEFRQRIRFDLDWGYDWAPFYELLVTAREHGEAIYGLDCTTCARSERVIATPSTRWRRYGSAIPAPPSWCCSASRTWRPGIFRECCASACRTSGCSPCCKTWTRFTGAPPASRRSA
jgi:hypothetical protein